MIEAEDESPSLNDTSNQKEEPQIPLNTPPRQTKHPNNDGKLESQPKGERDKTGLTQEEKDEAEALVDTTYLQAFRGFDATLSAVSQPDFLSLSILTDSLKRECLTKVGMQKSIVSRSTTSPRKSLVFTESGTTQR